MVLFHVPIAFLFFIFLNPEKLSHNFALVIGEEEKSKRERTTKVAFFFGLLA